jgi:hypothetical protein
MQEAMDNLLAMADISEKVSTISENSGYVDNCVSTLSDSDNTDAEASLMEQIGLKDLYAQYMTIEEYYNENIWLAYNYEIEFSDECEGTMTSEYQNYENLRQNLALAQSTLSTVMQ